MAEAPRKVLLKRRESTGAHPTTAPDPRGAQPRASGRFRANRKATARQDGDPNADDPPPPATRGVGLSPTPRPAPGRARTARGPRRGQGERGSRPRGAAARAAGRVSSARLGGGSVLYVLRSAASAKPREQRSQRHQLEAEAAAEARLLPVPPR